MSDNGDLREDLKIPEGEIGQQLKNEYDAGKELLVRINYIIYLFKKKIKFIKYIPIKINYLISYFQCTVLKSCGEECVIAIKTNTALDK